MTDWSAVGYALGAVILILLFLYAVSLGLSIINKMRNHE